ncbi:PilN domain-containing protein [Thioalkalivibrio sp. ALE11]|uniref:PilN domain-containing protein n=1 Tax=Thioalkalivibrio sp. ALE11 TaxID=1265494 RepID=UPI000368363A|nr:PilN domain-containing protein [Thioalkalivibrio sp. ALE11]
MIERSGTLGGQLRAWRGRASDFLRWWVGELAGMLPPRVRERLRFADRRIELHTDGGSVRVLALALEEQVLERQVDDDLAELHEVLERAREELGSDSKLVLCLHPPQSLVREIQLPAAASENLAQVLRYEMDRYTPFTADSVYYSYRILGRTPDDALRVQLAVALRQRLDGLMERLRVREVYPAHVFAAGAVGMDLAPRSGQTVSARSWVSVRKLLTGAVAVALLLTLTLPLWVLRDTAIQLNQEVADLRGVAMEAEDLREERNSLEHQTQYLVSRKQEQPAALEILEELSATLPDEAWLRDLEVRGDRVEIQGLAASASGLIERMESSPLFRDVSFAAPVTTDSRSGQDSFRISLRVTSGAADEG